MSGDSLEEQTLRREGKGREPAGAGAMSELPANLQALDNHAKDSLKAIQ